MLKIHRTQILVVALLLCIAGGSLAAYGAFWITSNVVHEEIQYVVVLSRSVLDSNVTLNAAVTNNGYPARAGLSVGFYYSLNQGEWTNFATQSTDAGGVAQVIYTVTANGGYDFEAILIIP